jgi:two-component system phosphate regulon response regulator PhoB
MRVLIAEDDDSLRKLIRLTVEMGWSDFDIDVDEASDGTTAVVLAQANAPDLVLLDWMMPGLTGLEVCRGLRADPRTAGALIVMVTARALSTDREAALAAGVDHYVPKPFSPLALLETVRVAF